MKMKSVFDVPAHSCHGRPPRPIGCSWERLKVCAIGRLTEVLCDRPKVWSGARSEV